MTTYLNELPSLYTFQQLINKHGIFKGIHLLLDKVGILEEDQAKFIFTLVDDFGQETVEQMDAVDLYDIIDGFIDGLVDSSLLLD